MVEFQQSISLSEYTPELPRSLDDFIEIATRNPRGLPETFGATPLNRVATFQDQALLLNKLDALLINPPQEIPASVQRYVSETFHDRFYMRCVANDENYHRALIGRSTYDVPVLNDLFDRAEMGFASPAELLLVQKLRGIPSIELACVTHPYGRRIEEVHHMRAAVNDAILSMGGELFDDHHPRLRIKTVVLENVPPEAMPRVYGATDQACLQMAAEYDGVACFLVIRKRDIGRMPDGTVIRERFSFCLRADAGSVLNDADIAVMGHLESSAWDDEALAAAGLEEAVLKLLEENEFTQVIPVSSTTYATNDAFHEKAALQSKPNREIDFSMVHLRTMK